MAQKFVLVRTTPAGEEKTHSPVARRRDAAVAAGMALHYNTGLPKADAQRFSVTLEKAPLGETLTHEPTGYAFRIERAAH